MKKRIYAVLLILLLSVGIVACKKTDDGNGGGGGTGENPEPGGKPTEIVIMHGAVHEIDPRHENFSGREKAKRLQLHEEVEKELNVKIVYKEYPANAPWGDGRKESIINWHTAGQPRADIYWLTTIWLGDIAGSGAIVPIDKWLNTHGKNIDKSVTDVAQFRGQVYGAAPEPVTNELGIFFNVDLLESKGIDNPVDLYNEGNWTWKTFEEWAKKAQTALAEDEYVLGGVPSKWAESLVPLAGVQGNKLIDIELETVMLNSPEAIDTYDFLQGLWDAGLFEKDGKYDTGSDAWKASKVLTHPGSLWFVRASNRWGDLDFEKGVVPYPVDDRFKGEYVAPVGGEAVYTIAKNAKDPQKEELAFEVWNKLQLWETKEQLNKTFRESLTKTFDDKKYVDVYMTVYDKVYYEALTEIGIAAYGDTSWQVNVNRGVAEGSIKTKVDSILPIYRSQLAKYLGKETK